MEYNKFLKNKLEKSLTFVKEDIDRHADNKTICMELYLMNIKSVELQLLLGAMTILLAGAI